MNQNGCLIVVHSRAILQNLVIDVETILHPINSSVPKVVIMAKNMNLHFICPTELGRLVRGMLNGLLKKS